MNKKEAFYEYCIRLADNSLIQGQRLSEMCSRAPFIEEDLALTNIALDMIGRAQAIYKYAAGMEEKGKSEDDLAYRREEKEYHNQLITEIPNGDFAQLMAKHFYISAYELFLYSELEKCKDETLAGIASKAIKEIRYHWEHVSDWVLRLGDGTEISHKKMQKALNELWPYTAEMFEMDEIEMCLLKEGLAVDLIPVKARWEHEILRVISEATLIPPDDTYMQSGGRKGIHTEHMGHLLAEMQYLQRTYPDAKW